MNKKIIIIVVMVAVLIIIVAGCSLFLKRGGDMTRDQTTRIRNWLKGLDLSE